MTSWTHDEAGMRAAEEFYKKVHELYMQQRRDPDNPKEYAGLSDERAKVVRMGIEMYNRELERKIEIDLMDSYRGRPRQVYVYKSGEYKLSVVETIKAIVKYYIKKIRRKIERL